LFSSPKWRLSKMRSDQQTEDAQSQPTVDHDDVDALPEPEGSTDDEVAAAVSAVEPL
jgi:hypothetical protein